MQKRTAFRLMKISIFSQTKAKMRFLLLFLLLPIAVMGQTISGYVYDEAEDLPMPGATVYIDGTTLSAVTNAEGYFRITAATTYNAALIVSYIGYKTLNIPNPFSYDKPLKILMREDTINLDDVTVTNKPGPFTRKEMLRVFREQFLGQSKAGRSCTIENENDIVLHYDTETNSLTAYAKKPLRVINKRLEYIVVFDLLDFSLSYRRQTLDANYLNSSFFAGTTLFTDIAKKKEKVAEIRKESYLGSTTHLMKTIITDDWEKQKFRLFVGSFLANPKQYLKISDSLSFKKVTLLDPNKRDGVSTAGMNLGQNEVQQGYVPAKDIRYNVTYDGERQSVFMFNKGHFYVDPNGLFFPLTELVFGGYMASLKVGDLLPVDYNHEE